MEGAWALGGVCEGNGDGGVGADQGGDAQRLLGLWMEATSAQQHTHISTLRLHYDKCSHKKMDHDLFFSF